MIAQRIFSKPKVLSITFLADECFMLNNSSFVFGGFFSSHLDGTVGLCMEQEILRSSCIQRRLGNNILCNRNICMCLSTVDTIYTSN